MEGKDYQYVKRTRKDCSEPFRLSVVSEVEQGKIFITSTQKKYNIQSKATTINWLRRCGTFNWEDQTFK